MILLRNDFRVEWIDKREADKPPFKLVPETIVLQADELLFFRVGVSNQIILEQILGGVPTDHLFPIFIT